MPKHDSNAARVELRVAHVLLDFQGFCDASTLMATKEICLNGSRNAISGRNQIRRFRAKLFWSCSRSGEQTRIGGLHLPKAFYTAESMLIHSSMCHTVSLINQEHFQEYLSAEEPRIDISLLQESEHSR